jgi:hypothetical protein
LDDDEKDDDDEDDHDQPLGLFGRIQDHCKAAVNSGQWSMVVPTEEAEMQSAYLLGSRLAFGWDRRLGRKHMLVALYQVRT